MSKKEKHKKEPKRKPKYGLLSCVKYIYQILWNTERSLVFTAIFTVPVWVILSALSLYTPSVFISLLENSEKFSYVALIITGLLLSKLLFDLINNVISQNISNSEHFVLMRLVYMRNQKMRSRDWYHEYDVNSIMLDDRAADAIMTNHTAGVHFPMDFANLLVNILKFIMYGSVVSMLHPLIILLLALVYLVNYFMSKWERNKNYSDRDVRNATDKKINYSTFDISSDLKYAKDIRLYSMKNFMHNCLEKLFSQSRNEQQKVENRSIATAIVSFLAVLIRNGAAYAYLIYKAVNGEVDASSFVLYFFRNNLTVGADGRTSRNFQPRI